MDHLHDQMLNNMYMFTHVDLTWDAENILKAKSQPFLTLLSQLYSSSCKKNVYLTLNVSLMLTVDY